MLRAVGIVGGAAPRPIEGGGTVERAAGDSGGGGGSLGAGAGGMPIIVRGRPTLGDDFFCKSSNTSRSDPGGLGGFFPS
jgi:hypothetical protein